MYDWRDDDRYVGGGKDEDLNPRHGDPIHVIVPSGKDARDIAEAARRFWQKRNMAPPCDAHANFTPTKKKDDECTQ